MGGQVTIGKFGSPYGIKGWLKVISYTSPIEKILEYMPWYVRKNASIRVLSNIKGKLHGNHLIVQLEECQDRDQAKGYTNLDIFIEREQLPEPAQDEYYWVDLIGLTVINREDRNLGKVERLFETGSNDVIIAKDKYGKERYIPYTKDVIIQVNLKEQIILVDWDADF